MPGRRDTYINMWQIFIVLENSLQKANKKLIAWQAWTFKATELNGMTLRWVTSNLMFLEPGVPSENHPKREPELS